MSANVVDIASKLTTTAPELVSLEAEQQLLAALLADNATYPKVADLIGIEDFSDATHQEIFRLITGMIAKGEQASVVRLRQYLAPSEAAYTLKLASSLVTIVNAGDMALTVRDLSVRRQLVQAGALIQGSARVSDPDADPFSMLDRAQDMLANIGAGAGRVSGPRSAADVLASALRQIEAAHKGAPIGLRTGLRDLDNILGGLERGTLTILAARPAMGKSALSAVLADNIAKPTQDGSPGEPVAFFQLEMSADQLGQRAIAARAGLPLHALRTGRLSTAQVVEAHRAAQDLEQVQIFIDDTPARTVPQILTRARQIKARHGLSLVIVDHMQLVVPTHSKGNRTEIVTEISGALKAMAKILDVPVLVLSQLSRAVEGRDDKRPALADLRESGSIEQDADVVIFLYRDSYYIGRDEPKRRADESDLRYFDRVENWKGRQEGARGIAELIVAKQRQGPIGTVRVHYDETTGRFGDLHEDRGDRM